MLAEWLGRINTLYGFVPAEELALVVADSVCANLPLPTKGVQEAATDPIRVCMGLPCALAGADARFKELSAEAADEAHSVVSETCLGRCWMTPAVAMGDCPCRDPVGEAPNTSYDLSLYLRSGGYSVLKSCHSKRRSPESIIDGLSAPSLASFEGHDAPLGARLKALRQRGSVPRLLLLVEDGPPGDMCDAFFLEHHPHHVLEGLLITAFAVGAREVVVHGTPNQAQAVRKLKREFAALAESGLGQHVNLTCSVQADRSPTCDLALLQLLATGAKQPEGRVNGAIPSPVVVLQSIVLRWIPEIISKGADWLVQAGASRSEPLRFYSISGRVVRPGVYLALSGCSVHELIEIAGGVAPGYEFVSFVAGDWSNPALPSRLGNMRIEPAPLPSGTGRVRSFPIVVISNRDSFYRQCAFENPTGSAWDSEADENDALKHQKR